MQSHDLEPFALMLRRTFLACSAGGKEPDVDTVGLYFDLFAGTDLQTMAKALAFHTRHPERGRFPPRPADLTYALQQFDGHPSADEAWAIAVKAADESSTIVWTQPMATAWGVASALYERTPGQAANAFKEHYTSLVGKERDAGRPAQWQTSLGYDKGQAQAALQVAQSEGKLRQLGHEEQLLIEGKPLTIKPPSWLAEQWSALSSKLKAQVAEPSGKELACKADRERTAQLKKESAELSLRRE
jgi:hypothetical protein